MRGLRKYMPPFAPDISGASSVLYELGGIIVICDAGGCAGNVCGFDEPRWFTKKSCIFSAGLRDMDAIFGRDELLVKKLGEAAAEVKDAKFCAVIGTPVPAVIGTDYQALRLMIEKKTGLPAVMVETTGMRQYDLGEEKAYVELFTTFTKSKLETEEGRIGVIGATPLSTSDLSFNEKLEKVYPDKKIMCYGMGAGLEEVARASSAELNLVVSPSGIKAAKLLEKRFGTPYEVCYPLAADLIKEDVNKIRNAKNVLVIHQQVIANAVRHEVLSLNAEAQVTVASFFNLKADVQQDGDIFLNEEADFIALAKSGSYDLVICDNMLWPAFGEGIQFIDIPHFSCSGRLINE